VVPAVGNLASAERTQLDERQINAIKSQQRALTLQAKSIDSKSAAILLAREQYQLVSTGQSLIQVLPGIGPNDVDQSIGDPGLQPLVSPSSVRPW